MTHRPVQPIRLVPDDPPLSVATDSPPAAADAAPAAAPGGPVLQPGRVALHHCQVEVLTQCVCGHRVGVAFPAPQHAEWACAGCGRVAVCDLVLGFAHTSTPQLFRPDDMAVR